MWRNNVRMTLGCFYGIYSFRRRLKNEPQWKAATKCVNALSINCRSVNEVADAVRNINGRVVVMLNF